MTELQTPPPNLGLHRCQFPHGHLLCLLSHWSLCLLLLFGLFLFLKLIYIGIIDFPLGKSNTEESPEGRPFRGPALQPAGAGCVNLSSWHPPVIELHVQSPPSLPVIHSRTGRKEFSGFLWAGLSHPEAQGLHLKLEVSSRFQPTTGRENVQPFSN